MKQVFKVRVPAKGTQQFHHQRQRAPDVLHLAGATLVVASADSTYVQLVSAHDTEQHIDVLCEWWERTDHWDDSVGPSSSDPLSSGTISWAQSRLWRLLEPPHDILKQRAVRRRHDFWRTHLFPGPPDDLGMAMLALYDAANGQRDACNWSEIARIVGQMDDLLHRAENME